MLVVILEILSGNSLFFREYTTKSNGRFTVLKTTNSSFGIFKVYKYESIQLKQKSSVYEVM